MQAFGWSFLHAFILILDLSMKIDFFHKEKPEIKITASLLIPGIFWPQILFHQFATGCLLYM